MSEDAMRNDVEATVKRWFDALDRGDGAAALEVLDENVVWTNSSPETGLSDIVPWLGRYEGRDAVAGTFVIWGELSEVREFEVLKLFYQDDEAIAIVHEVALVKPTGLYYDIEFVQRLGVTNGKITRWTSYWDTSKGIVAFRGDLRSRLIAAVRSGDLQTAELALKAGVNPNSFDESGPLDALLIAAGLGDHAMVELLLAHGASPNVVDELAGTAPLHKACQRGSLPVVKALLDAGAMIDLQTATTGHTPLMEAVWYKWPNIVAHLLDRGAGLNQVTHYGFTLADHIAYAKNVNSRDQNKIAEMEKLIAVRRRRDEEAVANQALMAAVIDGDLEKVDCLLKEGAEVDERYPVLDGFNDRHTPLLVAAREGHTEIVRLLLKHGADVNAVEDTFGAVPLHKSTYNGHEEPTRLLASQPGIDLDFQGASNGYTPLHDALWHGFESCARILVDAGARLDILAYDGKLPVDIATEVFGADHELIPTLTPENPPTAPGGKRKVPWHARARSGAQALIEQLRVSGLVGGPETLAIGNPGSGEEWLYLELNQAVRMGLAEAAVGSIVDGAGRARNRPAIAVAHGFVGFSGLQGDVFNAMQRQSPMLVIVGVADSQAHTGESHMYADVEGAAKAAGAKYVKNATDAKTLIRDLRDAIVQAETPPFGPVVFIVGTNVGLAPNDETIFAPSLPNTRLAPPPEEIERLADGLLAADNPSILVGDGVARSGAQAELQRVAELLGADVWASMESEINFPRRHGLFAGNLGHMDDARGRRLLKDADFVMAVGTPIYQTVFNSKEPLVRRGVPVATISQDPRGVIKGHNDITLPIQGDPQRVLGILADFIEQKRTPERAAKAEARFRDQDKKKRANLKDRREAQLRESGVTMAKFAALLERKLREMQQRPVIFNEALDGAVGFTDHVENIDIPGKYFDTSGGSLGEWAGGIGAAMVAGPTIAIIGDGGFNYAPQSLWNAAQDRLPLGLVVANNAEYGLLFANLAAALEGRGIEPGSIPDPSFFRLPNIDYAKIAEGYGVPAMRVDREDQIAPAVDRLVEFNGPFLIDLVLKQQG